MEEAPKTITVTDEYIETIIDKMMEWVNTTDKPTVPHMLKHIRVAWKDFKMFLQHFPRLEVNFDIVKSYMHTLWYKKAFDKKEVNMPAHQAKILLHYLRLYDTHSRDATMEEKMKIAKIQKVAEMDYIIENYDEEPPRDPARAPTSSKKRKSPGETS